MSKYGEKFNTHGGLYPFRSNRPRLISIPGPELAIAQGWFNSFVLAVARDTFPEMAVGYNREGLVD